MLELSEVTLRSNGRVALSRVSLTVPIGKPTAISGLNAAGREAVGRLVSGTGKAEAGAVRLGGGDIDRMRKEKGRIARVSPATPAPSGQKVGKTAGAEAVRLAGLSAHVDAKLSALSRDQRARLLLAQAIVSRPALLIIEAPAGDVQDAARGGLVADMAAMLASFAGVCVILPERADETLGLAKHLVVLEGGAVVQQGAVGEVAGRPACIASAEATAWPVLDLLNVRIEGERCLLPDGSRLQMPEGMQLPLGGECTLAMRPDDITLERASPGCVRFVVRAGAEEQHGGRRYLRVGFGGVTWLCPSTGGSPPAGAVLNAFVDRTRLMVFDGEGRRLG